MDYTTLSLTDVATELDAIARDAQMTFGGLDERQLNWRPDERQWSVAQCFDHLLTSNRLIFTAAEEALDDRRPRSVWQRLPVLPGLFGRMLIRSQSPDGKRKVKTVAKAQPSASGIGEDVVRRFVEQQRQAATRVRAIDERQAARAVMISPFIPVVAYSVLDGWRLFAAHGRRHVEQARRVMLFPDFPTPLT